MKILITGDKNYNNRINVRKILYKINKPNIIVATFKQRYGADLLILELLKLLLKNVYYFKLYSLKYLLNCLQPRYKFDKHYNKHMFIDRNKDAILWADLIIIFINLQLTDDIFDLYNRSKLINKKIMVIRS